MTDKSDVNAAPVQPIVRHAVGKYEIADEFVAGMVAALKTEGRLLSESDHWLCGWDAGYEMKKDRNVRLNAYLRAIGMEEMATIRLV